MDNPMDKMICVGKNYLDHAQELGDAVPEMPVLFLKPPSAGIQAQTFGETLSIQLPKAHGSVHHECEIVTLLDERGKIQAVTLGLDMTLRDLQAKLKKNGHPWEMSKVFAGSAILGPWIPIADFPNYLDTEFAFTVEGSVRQKGQGSQMRLSPAECVKYAAQYFPIAAGDVVFTGTPAGVGPVQSGQTSELRWGTRMIFRVEWT